jgi:hypothetical protein
MTSVWAIAALWFSLALVAGLLSVWLRVSAAMTEVVIGMFAQLIFGATIGPEVLDTGETWVKVLSGVGVMKALEAKKPRTKAHTLAGDRRQRVQEVARRHQQAGR